MKEATTQGFTFDEVPLTDAQIIVSVGSGKYSDIILALCKRLPEVERANQDLPERERKAVRFMVPGNARLDEKTVKLLKMSVNKALKRQGIFWQASYSQRENCFVCVPLQGKSAKAPPNEPEHGAGRRTRGMTKQIRDLLLRGLSASEVAERLGISEKKVYWCQYSMRKNGELKGGVRQRSPRNSPAPPLLQKNVLDLIGEGLSKKAIAQRLGIKLPSVYSAAYRAKKRIANNGGK